MAIPIVALAWIYVVLMMSVAEATAVNGTVLGAVFTFVLYGLLPLGLVLYIMGTPARRRARKAAEAAGSASPAQGEHAAGEAVAPERKEP
jgi:hypothetical protein